MISTHMQHTLTCHISILVGHQLMQGARAAANHPVAEPMPWLGLQSWGKPVKGPGNSTALPVEQNSRECDAISFPVAIACPAWRWGAREHVKAPLHIMGAVDMWLNSNHHQPTSTRIMQAMLLISALRYLGKFNVRHLNVLPGIRVDCEECHQYHECLHSAAHCSAAPTSSAHRQTVKFMKFHFAFLHIRASLGALYRECAARSLTVAFSLTGTVMSWQVEACWCR